MKCYDCQAFIYESSRNLKTRRTEHKRATKNGDLNNNITEHRLKQNTLSTETVLSAEPTVRTVTSA